MPFTPEQLSPYYERIRNREEIEPNYSLSYEYLTGRITELPGFIDYYRNDEFSILHELLQKPDLSPENESLLLSFLNSTGIRERIHHRVAYEMLRPLWENKEQGLFDKILKIYRSLQFNDNDIFFYFLNGLSIREQDILQESTPLLNFMHQQVQQMPEDIIIDSIKPGNIHGFKPNLFVFLFRNLKDRAYEYANNFIINSNHNYDDIVLRTALKYEFSRFGPVYKERIDAMRTNGKINSGYELYLKYNGYNPEKNAKELVDWSEEYLNYYINHPTTHDYGFSSRHYQVINENYFSMPRYAWALYFIFKDNEAKGTAFLDQLLAVQVTLKKEVLKMLKTVLGNSYISYLLIAVFQKHEKHYEQNRQEYIFNELKNYNGEFDINVLWQFEKYRSKHTESQAIQFLIENDSNVTEKAIAAIEDTRKDIRLMAARILLTLGTPQAMITLKKAIDTETDDETRDLIWQTCSHEISTHITEEAITEMAAAAKKRGKLKKPVFTWLNEEKLPGLYLISGRRLTVEEVRLILYRMSRAKGMRTEAEIKPVLQLIDREKSADFAKAVYKAFEEKEFDAKYKFLLLLAALFGNDDIVNKFCTAITKWIDGGRKAMSEYGIEALALQGSNKALRWIEWFSRKYRNKKPYVSETALTALTAAAEELEISIHELGDRIVPDFGFEGLFKHFTINGDEYRAFVDSNFKLAFFNEDNKKLKSLPAAAANELKDEFKSIGKEVRDVVKAQSSRLEHYLVVQRKWSYAEWQQFFLNNPIMFIYATKLLWGVYDEKQQLISCFLCQEDTTLIDKDGNEVAAPEDHSIGIVHPISFSHEELQAWKKHFFELSIDPVFPQLERPVYLLPEEDKDKKIMEDFVGVPTDSGSIKNTLDKYGWRKGDSGDGGRIYTFHYTDYASHIEALLQVDGVNVFGFTDDATLGKLYFFDTLKNKPHFHDNPSSDKDERLIPPGNLSPVFYAEVIAAVKAIKVRKTDEV